MVTPIRWPLVGRSAELAEVKKHLLAGERGVVFLGPAGVGKTRLAAEALDLVTARGYLLLQVVATEAMSAIPLGQFATFLPDISHDTLRTTALRQVAAAIKERAAGRPVALFVDDIHLLDEVSAALTLQLTSNDDVFLLATMRTAEVPPDAVIALWQDEIVQRMDLQPLAETTMEELLERALGGPVEAQTRRFLLDRSAGNVLFLRELVSGALDGGHLVEESGLWHLNQGFEVSPRLVELVEARIAHLKDDERAALEFIALGGPLGASLLEQMVAPGTLRGLEERALLRIHREGQRVTSTLTHPVYSDVLRAMISPTRSRALYAQLADALEKLGARRRGDILHLALWRLEGGGSVDAKGMLEAAHRAWMLQDLGLARELATAAAQAGGGFEADLLVAQVQSRTGEAEAAETAMKALVARATDDDSKTRLATARIENLSYNLFRVEEAASVAAAAFEEIQSPLHRDELAAFRATMLDLRGERAALLSVSPIEGERTVRAQAWSSLMGAVGHMKIGQFDEALRLVDQGLAVYDSLSSGGMPFGPDNLRAIGSWTHCLAGRLDEAEGIAADAVSQGSWVSDAALAMALLAQGKVVSAARWAREGAVIARRSGQGMTLKYNLIPLAESLALKGDLAEADAVVAELRDSPMAGVQLLEADSLRAQAWFHVAAGNRPRARALLERAVDVADRTGDSVWATAALHDMARLDFARGALDQLEELAAAIEGPLVQARLRHVRAKVDGDPAELSAASVDFEVIGAALLAAETAADAARVLGRRGLIHEAGAAERRATDLAARCEGATTPALTAVVGARATLAPRQLDIALLAARGVPNKAIAAQLGLSLRTVENRLHETYSILGIAGRGELAEALKARNS